MAILNNLRTLDTESRFGTCALKLMFRRTLPKIDRKIDGIPFYQG